MPDSITILDLFADSVAAGSEKVAVRFERAQLTYGELNRKSNALAQRLKDGGTKKGDLIPVMVGNSLEIAICWLAVMKAGAVLVPFDPGWPPERSREGLRQIAGRMLLVAGELDEATTCAAQVLRVSSGDLVSTDDRVTLVTLTPDDLIYGFFTSGSTGQPKCALNYHRGILNRFLCMTAHFRDCEPKIVLLNSRHVFDSAVWQLLWPLTIGGEVVIPRQAGHLDLLHTVELIRRHRVTMTDFVPSIFNTLVEVAAKSPAVIDGLTSLRWLLIGGEEINAKAVTRFRALAPHVRLTNTYGPTESAIGMIFHDIVGDDTEQIPLGTPISNTYVAILDERFQTLAVDRVGEIYIGGDCLGAGYFNDEEKTCKAFVSNPVADIPGDRLYRTGDLGWRDSKGRIHFAGRFDSQVKVNGVRVELGEVERALLRHSGVQEAVVVCVDETLVSRKKLCAAVVSSIPVTAAQLTNHLRAILPEYLIPRDIMLLTGFPLTPNGKADRRAIAALFAGGRGQSSPGPSFECAELSALEAQILHQFRRALGKNDFDIEGDFFEHGGDSLAALEIVIGLQEYSARRIELSDVYDFPTVRRLGTFMTSSVPATVADDSDWAADATLTEAMIVPKNAAASPPRIVLVTGATGYVGAHLLTSLLRTLPRAKVVALVRATANEPTVLERCRSNLARHGLWDDTFDERLSVVAGDLTEPDLGIGGRQWDRMLSSVDSIVHCGAMVDFLRSYGELRSHNVTGTVEIAKLATSGVAKELHYISTVSPFDALKCQAQPESLFHPDTHISGYLQSKLIAEHLIARLQSRGLRATIYRLGEVGPGDGEVPNEKSFLTLLFWGCVHVGLFPQLPLQFEYSPVGHAAGELSRGVGGAAIGGGTFRLTQRTPISFLQLMGEARASGVAIAPGSYKDFLTGLDEFIDCGKAPRDAKLLRALISRYPTGDSLIADFSGGDGRIQTDESLIELPGADERRVANVLSGSMRR